MITIEKNVTSIGDAIDIIIGEVFGWDSDIAKSIREFINYKNPKSITTIPCSSDNNNTFSITRSSDIPSTNITNDTIGTTSENNQVIGDIKPNIIYWHGITTYKKFVEYALFVINGNIPTPLKLGNPYNLTIGNNFTSIRYPNNTSVSIKAFTNKDSIKYGINITFHSTPVCDPYIRESDEYKLAIKNGWKVKDDFHKPIKKNI